jgi:prepilin-type N-terminal cleavage/methylation domain-containing protein
MMRKLRGFTLIELLIVVAIIAILAAIAVPNFLEAQTRAKVSRAENDMRTIATALESYFVDFNLYPAYAKHGQPAQTQARTVDTGPLNNPTGVAAQRTFRIRSVPEPFNRFNTLTTPIAYLSSLPTDPFADTRGLAYRYTADIAGWIVGSYGPDTDQQSGGSLRWDNGTVQRNYIPVNNRANDSVEVFYNSRIAQPSITLLTGSSTNGAFTYDPTNGTSSRGDVYRVKQ